MKDPKGDSQRWLKEAKNDLVVAQDILKSKHFNYVCFLSEQIAQKALKAFLYYQGKRFIREHSIVKLAQDCISLDIEFEQAKDYGKRLDRYYLTTRYPDAVAPGAVPYELFDEKEAKEAIGFAQELVNLVEKKII